MDKNTTSTMERRFSFNATHIPNPIAESTCLNGTSSATHFHWGGTPISPKNRSNSSICLSSASSSSMSHSGGRNSVTSPQRSGRANMSKIDPRIYADVQSKGLASRIVKYHESGTRLCRSMSANNLYNKPGQFPVVHLKKTELPYKATKQHLSMTRIAPPEKSMFYGNTLSSLLRSNSIIGLQKTDEEISRENRPILHPPPTENELAPTRSVLDVLKEISRKRINSDDMAQNDTTKKYCNRDNNNDVVDTTNPANHQQQQQPQIGHSYKRQREQFNSNHNQHYVTQTQSSPIAAISVANASAAATAGGRIQLQQHSPEQVAKKRLCSYNNDITSSLSSSIIHNNKRKYYEQRRGKTSPLNDALQYSRVSPATSTVAATSSSDYEYESQKSKMLRYQPDLHLQQFSQALTCNTPITPIPATPSIQHADALSTSLPTNTTGTSATTAGIAQRTTSEPIYSSSKATSLLPPSSSAKTTTSAALKSKPKLTLFNKNYDENPETEIENEKTEGATEDDGEYAGIQFVKPKKSSSISSTKNALIERTQKSKLALMLCGLRGELYQGEEQVLEEKQRQRQNAAVKKDEIDAVRNQQSSAAVANKNATTTATVEATSLLPLPPPTTIVTTTTTSAVHTTKPSIIGINNLKAKETLPETSAATALTSSSASILTATSIQATPLTTTATTAVLGGFKFTPPSATSAPAVSATPAAPTKTTSPLVGLKLTPQTTTATASVTNNNNSSAIPMPRFDFGATNNSKASVTTATALPVLGGFTFNTGGANISLNFTTPSPAATSTTITTSQLNGGEGGSFSFAPTTTAVSSAPAAAQVFGSLTNNSAPFAFGSTSAPATTTPAATIVPTFGTVTTAATAPPSFSNLNTVASIGNEMPKPFAFGSSLAAGTDANKIPTLADSSGRNNPFGGSSGSGNTFTAPTAAATTKSFSFGNTATSAFTTATAAAATTTTTSAAGGFSFNTATSQKLSTGTVPFAFGGAASGQTPVTQSANSAFAAPNFTTAAGTAVSNSNTFAFGSAASNTTFSAPTAANNSFSFGSGGNTVASASTNSSIFGSGAGSANTSAGGAPFAFGSGGTAAATTAAATQQQTQAQPPPAYAFGGSNGGDTAANRSPNVSPFAFGGAAKIDKPTTGGAFTFGAQVVTASSPANVGTSATAASNTNLFGTPQTNAATTTGIVKPTFSFGNSNATTATNAAVNKPSLFGASADMSNNTFGSLAAASGSGGGAGDSANNYQNKTFTFATNNNNNHNTSALQSNNNIFGGGASTAANDNHKPLAASGGFSFGTASATNVQLQQHQNNPTQNAGAFTFGSSAGISNNAGSIAPSNAVAPFAFSGTSGSNSMAPPKIDAANKTFAFGGSNNGGNIAKPGNIFAGAAAAGNNANAPPPFNFNAGSGGSGNAATGGPSSVAPSNAGNMFAAPQGDRLIRRATRRLQKS